MAEIFHPTKFRAKDPWLIDSTQLLALDDAIDQYRAKSLGAGVANEEASPSNTDESARTIKRG